MRRDCGAPPVELVGLSDGGGLGGWESVDWKRRVRARDAGLRLGRERGDVDGRGARARAGAR